MKNSLHKKRIKVNGYEVFCREKLKIQSNLTFEFELITWNRRGSASINMFDFDRQSLRIVGGYYRFITAYSIIGIIIVDITIVWRFRIGK